MGKHFSSHNEKNNQSNKTAPKLIWMFESAEKDIKIIMLHNFKKLRRDTEDAKANTKL